MKAHLGTAGSSANDCTASAVAEPLPAALPGREPDRPNDDWQQAGNLHGALGTINGE